MDRNVWLIILKWTLCLRTRHVLFIFSIFSIFTHL